MVDCTIEHELTSRYFTGLPFLIIIALLVCFAAIQLEQRILIGHFAFGIAVCADVVHRVSAAFGHLHDRGDMGHVSSFPTLSNEKAMRILPFRIARRVIVGYTFMNLIHFSMSTVSALSFIEQKITGFTEMKSARLDDGR